MYYAAFCEGVKFDSCAGREDLYGGEAGTPNECSPANYILPDGTPWPHNNDARVEGRVPTTEGGNYQSSEGKTTSPCPCTTTFWWTNPVLPHILCHVPMSRTHVTFTCHVPMHAPIRVTHAWHSSDTRLALAWHSPGTRLAYVLPHRSPVGSGDAPASASSGAALPRHPLLRGHLRCRVSHRRHLPSPRRRTHRPQP